MVVTIYCPGGAVTLTKKAAEENVFSHAWSNTSKDGKYKLVHWICRKCGAISYAGLTGEFPKKLPKYFEYSCEEKIMRKALE